MDFRGTHFFYIYWRDYHIGVGSIDNEVMWSFTQLEPVWFLFNLAGLPARESCSFSNVYIQVCLYFYFSRSQMFHILSLSLSPPLKFGKPFLCTMPALLNSCDSVLDQ